MNILISTWSLQVGGGEVLAMNLAAELARRGHKVFLFNQRAELIDHDLVQRLLPPEVKVLSMADRPRRSFWAYKINALQQRLGRKGVFYLKQQQAYLTDCLKSYHIDLLNSHSTFSDELCASVVEKMSIPMVITEHGEYTRFALEGRRDFVNVLRTAKRILTVSHYCKGHLEHCFASLPVIKTVYNGVVTRTYEVAEMRKALIIPVNAFVFGMVARGITEKGWLQAVQAFQLFKATASGQPVRLVLVGGSTYLRQLQTEYEADTDIHFVGQVPNSDFYISGFDVGLLPTYFAAEALPLAVIEYMVSGKPTIATQVGGIPELLNLPTGPTGQLILLDEHTHKPRVDMLVAAMQRYYENTDLYAMHASNAIAARENFTMKTCADQYEQAFAASRTT